MKRTNYLLLACLLLLTCGLLSAAEEGRGYLGVTLTQVQNTDVGKEDNGIYIHEILPGGGAEAAGLAKHDQIVEIDGTKVATMADLHGVLGSANAGDSIGVTLLRDGVEQSLSVVLAELPTEHLGRWAMVVDEKRAMFGVHIQKLNPQLAEYFGVEAGVLVTEVIEDGPAAEAGLLAGDVVVEVNDHPVSGREMLHHAIADVKPGDEVEVQLQRRGQPMTLYVVAGDHQTMSRTMNLQLKELHELLEGDLSGTTIELVHPTMGHKELRELHELHRVRDFHERQLHQHEHEMNERKDD